jgi:long-subunit acyl-CoA synthetase (AMP-forming)
VEETVSSDIVRRRAEIEGVMAGRTLCDELRHVAETSGEAWAYSDEAVTGAGDGWQSLTWSQARQQVLEAAAGFAALGLAPGERVALMLPNCSEHVLADLGAVHAGGLGVTLYATLAPELIAYVAGDCDARIAVLNGAAELARWQPILEQLPGITTIIVRDQAACPAGDRYMTWADFVELAAQFQAAHERVLGPVRSLLGLGEATSVLSGAAPLPPDVAAFLAGLGMKILDVYGMTETTGAFTANTPTEFRLGTVGRPVAGMEVRIAEDGEILVRGPLTTPGYLNRPDQTEALIDADRWLRTGDIGTIDADGFVSVTDRKKELVITAGGENIAPAAVENALVAHPLIGQALAYGDRRPYMVALLTLDGEAAPPGPGPVASPPVHLRRWHRTRRYWPKWRPGWPPPTNGWPGSSR